MELRDLPGLSPGFRRWSPTEWNGNPINASPIPLAIPATRDPVFGVFTTDELGRLKLEETRDIPNEPGQRFGWVLWVGESDLPVTWSELLPARAPPPSAASSGQAPSFHSSMVPSEGFIYSIWVMELGVSGDSSMLVSLPGGRSESFDYTLGPEQLPCPFREVYLDWHEGKEMEWLGPGPRGVERTKQVIFPFAAQLFSHPDLRVTRDLDEAYWIVNALAMLSHDSDYAFGKLRMRPITDFHGKARRYSSLTTSDESAIDYGLLFEYPIADLDSAMKEAANTVAGKLTPHVRKKCADWASGQIEEEARLEKIRAELVEEMTRIRRARALLKMLTIEPEYE